MSANCASGGRPYTARQPIAGSCAFNKTCTVANHWGKWAAYPSCTGLTQGGGIGEGGVLKAACRGSSLILCGEARFTPKGTSAPKGRETLPCYWCSCAG